MEYHSSASLNDHDFPRPVIATIVHVQVQTWHTSIVLDVEFFGCELTNECELNIIYIHVHVNDRTKYTKGM